MTNAIHFILILLQYLAIRLIKFYQKHISPNKGFCCAYHKYTGGRSCSNYALTAVRRYGISALWVTFPKRLDDCKIAAIRLNKESEEKKNKKKINVIVSIVYLVISVIGLMDLMDLMVVVDVMDVVVIYQHLLSFL